jgi:transcriptional regulator with XRE-family HTH domain
MGETTRRNRAASQAIRHRLADNVRQLRRARGYTQRDLADLCQFTKSYISNVEQGTVNISLANLEAFAAALVCREWELLR